MQGEDTVRRRFERAAGVLDERRRRAVAASEALALGWGGITAVARATGLSRKAIHLGVKELTGAMPSAERGRVRRVGGGRKKAIDLNARLPSDLKRLVEPATRGDPEPALRWTCKSVRK